MKKAKKHLSQGMTIVEMIVAFAIFAVMAMMFISIIIPANNMHYETQTWKNEINAQASGVEAKSGGLPDTQASKTLKFGSLETSFQATPIDDANASDMTHLRYFQSEYPIPQIATLSLRFQATDTAPVSTSATKNVVEVLLHPTDSAPSTSGVRDGTDYKLDSWVNALSWDPSKTNRSLFSVNVIMEVPTGESCGSTLSVRIKNTETDPEHVSGIFTFTSNDLYAARNGTTVTFVYDGSTITLK